MNSITIHEATTGDVYLYHISDHLGNVRVSFSVNTNHTVSVESYGLPPVDTVLSLESRFTTFIPTKRGRESVGHASGWEMPGRTHTSANRTRFGYQGAFTENDADLGMTTFDLRAYDARLMRWHNPDPYDQYHSPYVAMGNDWVNGVDADGGFYQELWNWIKSGFKKEGWISNEAKAFMESHPGSEYDWVGSRAAGHGWVSKYQFKGEDGEWYNGAKKFEAINDGGGAEWITILFGGNKVSDWADRTGLVWNILGWMADAKADRAMKGMVPMDRWFSAKNGKWYNTGKFLGNKYTDKAKDVLAKMSANNAALAKTAKYWNRAGKALGWVGVANSVFEAISAEDTYGKVKGTGEVILGIAMIYGGPVTLAVGTTYFVVDTFIGVENVGAGIKSGLTTHGELLLNQEVPNFGYSRLWQRY